MYLSTIIFTLAIASLALSTPASAQHRQLDRRDFQDTLPDDFQQQQCISAFSQPPFNQIPKPKKEDCQALIDKISAGADLDIATVGPENELTASEDLGIDTDESYWLRNDDDDVRGAGYGAFEMASANGSSTGCWLSIVAKNDSDPSNGIAQITMQVTSECWPIG